jgi:Flp pilus assembly protein TadD
LLDLYAARGDSANLKVLVQQTLELSGNDSAARDYLATSVIPPPGSSAEWYKRGQGYTSTANHARAAYAYRLSTVLDPTNADAWNGLGASLNELGFFSEAISPLERAVALRPANSGARKNLAFAKAHI